MADEKDDIVFLEVVLAACNDALGFINGFDEDNFLRDTLVKSGVLLQLIVIGEYGSKISEKLRGKFTDVEWHQIRAARNFYVHVYNRVDWIKVWDTVTSDVPELKKKIQYILEEISED